MIEIRNLSAGYSKRPFLKEISLSIPGGAVTVLLGPNGSGKSTLLKAITGLVPLTGGAVQLDGICTESLCPRLRAQRIAYLPQSRNVPNITAYRMVLHGRFPYLSYPRHYRETDRSAVWDALKQMEAQELADIPLPQLSGGQRQRVYLAMTLAQNTPNILMDEPTTYLDIKHQLEFMQTAHRLASDGKAVCIVLHDLCLALQTADFIAVLENGAVRFLGAPEALYEENIIKDTFGVAVKRIDTELGSRYVYV
ncbi:MAG: ABC transporter ATP-binding protein [Oscillospiraceae bacterium]|nr:ABC transporter ATP-binding protein [Oscillospiraceae bacterium]